MNQESAEFGLDHALGTRLDDFPNRLKSNTDLGSRAKNDIFEHPGAASSKNVAWSDPYMTAIRPEWDMSQTSASYTAPNVYGQRPLVRLPTGSLAANHSQISNASKKSFVTFPTIEEIWERLDQEEKKKPEDIKPPSTSLNACEVADDDLIYMSSIQNRQGDHTVAQSTEQSITDADTRTCQDDDHIPIFAHLLRTDEPLRDPRDRKLMGNRDEVKMIKNPSASAGANILRRFTTSRTMGSTKPTIRGTEVGFRVSELAETLAAVLPTSAPKEAVANLKNALPSLLEAFSVRMGNMEPSPILWRFKCLISTHREQIAKAVTEVFAFEEKSGLGEVSDLPKVQDMSITDKMSLWEKQQDLPKDDGQDTALWDDENNATDGAEDPVELQTFCKDLVHFKSFAWLKSAMLREIQLETVGGLNARADIRKKIFNAVFGDANKASPLNGELPWPQTRRLGQVPTAAGLAVG